MRVPDVCLKGVSFSYPGTGRVLEEIDLDVYAGELLCLVGPNGGGKTTLLELILGKWSPDCGTVLLGGKPPAAQAKRIGYVPQAIEWDPEYPILVEEVVRTSRARLGWYNRRDRQVVEEALVVAGLADQAGASFSELSGGMRQRTLLARALASEPDILLLDEPTANVDPLNARRLHEALESIQGKMTCILVSHDVEFVTALAPKVACVHRKLDVHPTEAFRDEHAEALFGTPLRKVVHDRTLKGPGHDHD